MKCVLPVYFAFLLGIVICTNYTCDYSFGNPSWNYSKLFYNTTHVLPEGVLNFNVTLPQNKNSMISFVCVNITGADLNTTKVAFASLFRRLSIEFKNYPQNGTARILALEHGY
ncbi:unnamed protein product [Leptosia nina]|uniref:Uncharacterized protein n=1 Tax=Leptosia nina TaxID=320188 RepID=A0AAV1JMQ4_9NEOP